MPVPEGLALPILDLSRNEKPDPVPDSLRIALGQAINKLGRYPVGLEDRVIDLIADTYQIPASHVMLVHGIDETLDSLINRFPDLFWKTFNPTFSGYDIRLRIYQCQHTAIDLGPTYDVEHLGVPRVTKHDFVVLANPNNPTGGQVAQNVLCQLADCSGQLLVDEAYIHFSGTASALPVLLERAFVFQSLSKAFGLAGQRLGFLFGPAQDIRAMRQRQWYCNIDSLSLAAIAHILSEKLHEQHAQKLIFRRQALLTAISKLGYDTVSTKTNFLLIRTLNTSALAEFMANNRILVFDTAEFGLPHHIRISIGTDAENSRLLTCLAKFAECHKPF